MSLTQGEPLPSIETTKEIETTAPDWYTDYLKNLATEGTSYIGMAPESLASPASDIQRDLFRTAATDLGSYTGALGAAQTALTGLTDIDLAPYSGTMGKAQTALTGLTDIDLYGDYMQNLMDKYEDDVVQEMARQQQLDMQRYMLPMMKGAFVGSGGLGGQRYAGALGQMTGDVAANLAGQQAGLRQKGFSEAMTAALRQADIERGAASDLGRIGFDELQAALRGAEIERAAASDLSQLGSFESQAAERRARTLSDIGKTERDIAQERLLAPLSATKTAADLFANLKVPSTVFETAVGPIPGAYSTSPLSQIAGLGTLFAAGTGGKSAMEGFGEFVGAIPEAIRGFGNLFPSGGTSGGNYTANPAEDYLIK